MNVNENEAAQARFALSPLRNLPVIKVGSQYIPGIDLPRVAQLLGLDYDAESLLPVQTLRTRLIEINQMLAELLPRISLEFQQVQLPGRDRTVLGLLNHILEISRVFTEVADGNPFTAQRAHAEPAGQRNPSELLGFIESLREIISTQDLNGMTRVNTYYGDQSVQEVMSRTVWHSAQHLRQLAWLCERHGVLDEPFDLSPILQDLPLPQEVWD